MNYSKEVLSNKLNVIHIPLDSVKSATVLVLAKVGSRFETKELNGISHFLEHMAFKGTKKYPTSLDISSKLDGIGGEFNAFTSKEYTGFYVKSASNHIPLVIDILSEMVLNPILAEEEVERERGVILEEIRMYKDMPARYVGDIYEMLVFGDHPLGWDTAGTEESLKNIAKKEIADYFKTFYKANNMLVGVAGGVEKEESFKLIQNAFVGLENNEVPAYLPLEKTQNEPAISLYFKETEQAHFSLGVRSYPLGHPKRYALAVLNNVLGGTMSSRLFTSLRERRGLAYYVRSGVSEYLDAGTLAAQAGVEKKNLLESLEIILQEFAKIASYGVKEEELRKGKENLKGHLILSLEDSKDVASLFLIHQLLEGKIYTPEEIISGIESVTEQEVQEVAKEIFKKELLNLAIIGPFKDENIFKEVLNKYE